MATAEPFGEVVYTYTRAQAVEDGQLVSLNEVAPDVCSQHLPGKSVVCTMAVWGIIERAVQHPRWCNDYNGVIHDLLWMSRFGMRPDPSTSIFKCMVKGAGRQSVYTFKCVCGPGDDGEPVITLMLPEED